MLKSVIHNSGFSHFKFEHKFLCLHSNRKPIFNTVFVGLTFFAKSLKPTQQKGNQAIDSLFHFTKFPLINNTNNYYAIN